MTKELAMLIITILVNLVAASLVVMLLKGKLPKFSLHRYFALLVIPMATLGYLVVHYGWIVLILFGVFAVMGTCIEYLLGFTFYKMCNQRVWEYSLYSWSGFTSWLAVLPWGFYGMSILGAGIVILQLANISLP